MNGKNIPSRGLRLQPLRAAATCVLRTQTPCSGHGAKSHTLAASSLTHASRFPQLPGRSETYLLSRASKSHPGAG